MNTQKLKCMIIDDDEISLQIIEKYIEKTENLTLASSHSTPVEARKELSNNNTIDILFLDVEMPEESGFDMLDLLVEKPHIILISSKANYALDAFEYDITDFLLKPVSYPRFQKAIFKVVEIINSTLNIPSAYEEVFVKHNQRLIKIAVGDILWIESIGDYVEIHTTERKYIAHTTMKALEKKLAFAKFIRVHRSYIVKLSNIQEIEEGTVVINKKLIPIGKAYRENLLKSINTI